MPLIIENNYGQVSLDDLVRLQAEGYSLVKSPHVGNQHPSNLVCAALGIPLEMVSFTQGVRDVNFHPHLRIQGGVHITLYDRYTWTQFAKTSDGQTATDYHQSAVRQVFPNTEVMTDMERMHQYPALAATVLRATNIKRSQSVWYRSVSEDGQIKNKSKGCLTDAELETNVFQFSNNQSGWVIPNKVHIIFDLIYQSLSSGRSLVYHLSGPQMVHYVSGIAGELSVLYDVVRKVIPELPFTLNVRIVPVASARFVTKCTDTSALIALSDVRNDLQSTDVVAEFVECFPDFTTPIESATTLSQYDIDSADDLILDPWMRAAPLSEVTRVHNLLVAASKQRLAA